MAEIVYPHDEELTDWLRAWFGIDAATGLVRGFALDVEPGKLPVLIVRCDLPKGALSALPDGVDVPETA